MVRNYKKETRNAKEKKERDIVIGLNDGSMIYWFWLIIISSVSLIAER